MQYLLRSRPVIAKPPFLIVACTCFALWIALTATISPAPAGLNILFPEYVRALELREAKGIPRGMSCDWMGDAWAYRQLVHGRQASTWFQSVFDHAVTAEARIYALSGLRQTDTLAFRSAMGRMSAQQWSTPVVVFPLDTLRRTVPGSSLIDDLVSGQLGIELMQERPEC